VISNLGLVGGSGEITFSFDYVNDGGAFDVTVNIYDALHALIHTFHPVVQIMSVTVNSPPSGSLEGSVDLSSLPGGEYSFELFMTTSDGTSDTLTGNFSVTGGFGADVVYPDAQNLNKTDTAIGDLNGDGRNDVAVLHIIYQGGSVLVYYQNASGGLDVPVITDLGFTPWGLAIGDLNDDGKADLAVSGDDETASPGLQGRLAVLLQDPATGELQPPQDYAVGSDDTGALAVADLNMDGRNDVVVSAPQGMGMSGNLALFFQNDSGTLNDEVVYDHVNVSYPPYQVGEIHVADMNHDGANDIVVQSGALELSVIKQTAPGVFSDTPEPYAVQTSYWSYFGAFALGDLNGDGRADAVTQDPGNSGYMNVFLQNDSGTLDSAVLVEQSYIPIIGLEIADITGDGLNDLLGDFSPGVRVYPQEVDHSFAAWDSYPYNPQSTGGSSVHQALSIGDVTGDGMPDAVVTWDSEGLHVLPYQAQILIE
jgi:hypothetical protein